MSAQDKPTFLVPDVKNQQVDFDFNDSPDTNVTQKFPERGRPVDHNMQDFGSDVQMLGPQRQGLRTNVQQSTGLTSTFGSGSNGGFGQGFTGAFVSTDGFAANDGHGSSTQKNEGFGSSENFEGSLRFAKAQEKDTSGTFGKANDKPSGGFGSDQTFGAFGASDTFGTGQAFGGGNEQGFGIVKQNADPSQDANNNRFQDRGGFINRNSYENRGNYNRGSFNDRGGTFGNRGGRGAYSNRGGGRGAYNNRNGAFNNNFGRDTNDFRNDINQFGNNTNNQFGTSQNNFGGGSSDVGASASQQGFFNRSDQGAFNRGGYNNRGSFGDRRGGSRGGRGGFRGSRGGFRGGYRGNGAFGDNQFGDRDQGGFRSQGAYRDNSYQRNQFGNSGGFRQNNNGWNNGQNSAPNQPQASTVKVEPQKSQFPELQTVRLARPLVQFSVLGTRISVAQRKIREQKNIQVLVLPFLTPKFQLSGGDIINHSRGNYRETFENKKDLILGHPYFQKGTVGSKLKEIIFIQVNKENAGTLLASGIASMLKTFNKETHNLEEGRIVIPLCEELGSCTEVFKRTVETIEELGGLYEIKAIEFNVNTIQKHLMRDVTGSLMEVVKTLFQQNKICLI